MNKIYRMLMQGVGEHRECVSTRGSTPRGYNAGARGRARRLDRGWRRGEGLCRMENYLADHMAADLADIARMHMPFGKFGPAQFPPHGVPIYDLPAEYLQWFSQRGWPRGELGRLLRIVYQMKADGSDSTFDPMRRAAGGRRVLRQPRRQDHKLIDD